MLIPERALPEGDEFKTYRDRLDLGNDAPVKHKVYAVHPSGNTLMPAEAMATWKNDKGEMEFKNHFNSVFKKGTWDKEPAHVTNARYAGQPPVMIRYNGDMIVTPSEVEAIGRSEGQETKASDFSGGYVMAAKLDGRATKENRLKLLGKESTARPQPPTSHSLKVLATMSREEIAPQAITALKGNGLDHMIPAVVKRERDDIPVKPKVEQTRDERGRDDRSASAGLAG